MLRIIALVLISLLASNVSFGQVTVIVQKIPANTPEKDPIHIAGNFQAWNPSDEAYKLEFDSFSGSFFIKLTDVVGDIEFKFTRGEWAKVESDADGRFINNRVHNIKDGDTLNLQILGWEDLDGNGGGTSTASENVEILTDSFYIPQLNRYRRVWIYLPPDYNETSYGYPVLYMHDGQNVFDAKTSFAGEWKIDETLNELHEKGDSGIIVVAIDNGGSNRTAEYTPWKNAQYGGGDGAKYVDFLVEELVPYINASYRTRTEPKYTGIMGSSLGGLISTYAAVKYPKVFGKVGSFSPAYWINPEIFGLEYQNGSLTNTKIYQIAGTNESETMVSNMLKMHDSLLTHGLGSDNIMSIDKTDGAHSEWFWAREFEDAYLWLFGNKPMNIENASSATSTVKLFPNPVQGDFTIDIHSITANKIEVEIIHINGVDIIVSFQSQSSSESTKLHFNTEVLGLSSGIYLVKVRIGAELITKKLFVQ